eukprot:1921880-Prymnesium_polylepis.1
MVDLLGGIKPASSWQGGRIIGGFACGRRGSPQGPTTLEDTERALRACARSDCGWRGVRCVRRARAVPRALRDDRPADGGAADVGGVDAG